MAPRETALVLQLFHRVPRPLLVVSARRGLEERERGTMAPRVRHGTGSSSTARGWAGAEAVSEWDIALSLSC